MTFIELSKETGLSTGYLCDLENIKAINPSLETMKKISDALKQSVNNVFFKELRG